MQIFSTQNTDLQGVSSELATRLPKTSTFILYFHSPRFTAVETAKMLADTFPGVPSLGCTTAGELVTGKMLDGSLVVAAFEADEVSKACAVPIETSDVKSALDQLTGQFDDINLDTHVGLILMDGMSGQEEMLMEKLGDSTDLTFVGGSAGDDMAFAKTSVSANGIVTSGPGVLALLQVPAGFDLIKTQSFTKTDQTLTPTRVDRENRAVLEFNGQPAAQAYAKAVGASSSEEAGNSFMNAPLGLMAGDEPYVRSPQRFDGDKLHFYCSVMENVELSLLKGTDIVTDTAKALEGSSHRALVVFNCILRTLDIKNNGQQNDFGSLFTRPTIGFATYGEAYIGHINQTATILALR